MEICLAPAFGFVIFSFYAVIQLPAFYKYGTLKGKLFTYIPMIAYGIFLFIALEFNVTAEGLFSFITDNLIMIVVALLLVFIMAYWISIGASIRALQNNMRTL